MTRENEVIGHGTPLTIADVDDMLEVMADSQEAAEDAARMVGGDDPPSDMQEAGPYLLLQGLLRRHGVETPDIDEDTCPRDWVGLMEWRGKNG